MGIFTYSDFNFSFVLFLEFATLENFFKYFYHELFRHTQV